MRTTILTMLLLCSLTISAQQQPSLSKRGANFSRIDPNVVTVKPKNPNSIIKNGLRVLHSNILGCYDIAVPKGKAAEDYIKELKESCEYEIVSPNYLSYTLDKKTHQEGEEFRTVPILQHEETSNNNIATAMTSAVYPNDTTLTTLWSLSKIKAFDSWSITMGNSSVQVALIGSGIDTTHVDLGYGVDGYTNINSSLGINCDILKSDIGTAIAGIIGAKTNNGIGMAGIAGGNHAHGATIIPYFSGHGTEAEPFEWYLVIDYILEATLDGADIIIIEPEIDKDSLNSDARYLLQNAINYAYNNGVTLISSTGYYPDYPSVAPIMCPAVFDNVIAVGACNYLTGSYFLVSSTSGFGEQVDLVAPGFGVFSTKRTQSYGELTRTCLAAAHVAGVAALMLSVNPNLTPEMVRTILRQTADKENYYTYTNGWNQYAGYGRVDAYAAVNMSQYYIDGTDTLCTTNVYTATGLPTGATVQWTLSGSNASKFNLVQNSPSANKCTITKKANAVFSSPTFTLTLTANIYQGSTLLKTKTKTLTCNNGFACTYWQDAHSQYGVNYPAITQTQMTSATNYVYPGGIVNLQSDYFRGKLITPSGTYDNFQHAGQNIVRFSLPPYTSSPAYINVAAKDCDEAIQLTFYPMSYYSKSGYSAQVMPADGQAYRVSLVRNKDEAATEEATDNDKADKDVAWTIEVVNALTGKKVFSTEPDDTDYLISTTGWGEGIYVLRVLIEGEPIFAEKIHVK